MSDDITGIFVDLEQGIRKFFYSRISWAAKGGEKT